MSQTFLDLAADPLYESRTNDIRTNISSGILVLGDGTPGGAPLSGINYGLPDLIRSRVERPTNIEGYTLQKLMNEFPSNTRVAQDKSSIGAQVLTPISQMVDELIDESTNVRDSQTLRFYPMYEQGNIYEYSYPDATDLHTNPPVSGGLVQAGLDFLSLMTRNSSGWLHLQG